MGFNKIRNWLKDHPGEIKKFCPIKSTFALKFLRHYSWNITTDEISS